MIVKRDGSQCIDVSSSVFDRVVYGNRESDTYATDCVDLAHKKFDGVSHLSRMWILISSFLLACGIIFHVFCCQDSTKRSCMTSVSLASV